MYLGSYIVFCSMHTKNYIKCKPVFKRGHDMVKQYWLNLRYITTKGQFSSFNKEHFSLNHVLCLISICFALKNLLNIQIPLGIFWNSLKQIILATIENPIVRLDQNYMLLLSLLYVTSNKAQNSYAIRYLQLHKIKNLLKNLAKFSHPKGI